MLAHPDDGSVESWSAVGSADKMRVDFAGWEPRSASYCCIGLFEIEEVLQGHKTSRHGPLYYEMEVDGSSTDSDLDSSRRPTCSFRRFLSPNAGM